MAWWKTARPGDKVVCVERPYSDEPIAIGAIYTVDEIAPMIAQDPDIGDVYVEISVAICEVDRREWLFPTTRFRPVQNNNRSTDTGMARLRSFLKDAKQPVSEEV